jgi:RNA polymerase sigma factor (sigma-70 family)
MSARVEDLLRESAPQVLGALVRRFGHFDIAEDAVQEALLAAATQWPDEGLPDNPLAWLITVGSRRLTDLLRAEQARRRREDEVSSWVLPADFAAPAADAGAPATDADDGLILLFMCCHPALTPASQIALALRAVGGLTTAEIASAFLVPEKTMAQRISRAKQQVKASNLPFRLPPPAQRPQRLQAVLHVLYLIFNEGYVASAGSSLHRVELAAEAIRLTRMMHRLLPGQGEVAGLLALMLLIDARRPARTAPDGALTPLGVQARRRWDRAQIAEGIALVEAALAQGPPGPYRLQAAIAAVHDEAPSAAETDWPQILALYELLARGTDNPVVWLNHAVALSMVKGPQAGLRAGERLASSGRGLDHGHRLDAVRAHLLEMAGDRHAARRAYQAAARLTSSVPEQRYLLAKAAGLARDGVS